MAVENHRKWKSHKGAIIATVNGFDVIHCENCGFKHILPVPSEKDLENIYQHDYYQNEKPLYIERYIEDIEWWNIVYTNRYKIFEKYLNSDRRNLLEIGSGPGYSLLCGNKRGWKVKGIEPSLKASEHSLGLGLDVINDFYSENTSIDLGKYDAVVMSEVLEHIPDPARLLSLVHAQLNPEGIVCVVVPNDFNPFQIVLRDHLGFDPWWVAPPHHINYFDFKSLEGLFNRCGFDVIHTESTFPIDMFLLMGDNYIGNDAQGRNCHSKRMNFEKILIKSENDSLLTNLYKSFSDQGIGREIVMFARVK